MEYLGPLANVAIFVGFLLLICVAYLLGTNHGWQDAEDWYFPDGIGETEAHLQRTYAEQFYADRQ